MKTQGFVPLLAGKARVCGAADFFPVIYLQADENEVFMRDFLQNLHVEVVHRKLSCERPSKSASWRCERAGFLEDVKTKLSCESPSKSASWSCAMEACARFPSKPASWRCESEAFVRDILPKPLFAVTTVLLFFQSSFFAVIPSLRPFFFAVIVLCSRCFCSHCALQSWFFAVMVPCRVGNRCIGENSRKTFLGHIHINMRQ